MLRATVLVLAVTVGAGTAVSNKSQQPVPTRSLLLFTDNSLFSSIDPRLELRNNAPAKGPRVISPTEPWESWAVYAFNSVVHVGPGDNRMYYDCVDSKEGPNGTVVCGTEFVCLATSADGITWVKPKLGIHSYSSNGSAPSKENNILVKGVGPGVFLDDNPLCPASERWKMAVTEGAFASPDGLHWSKLPHKVTARDDTKPTGYWDPRLRKYVISVRRDVKGRNRLGTKITQRHIGRCETTNFSDWEQESPGGCPVVFSANEEEDGSTTDIYTNAWTPYPSIQNLAVHLFFPR